MMDEENESLADWLFYARKHQRRRRTSHTTHSSTNTEDEN